MKIKECPTFWANIYIAGDYDDAVRSCREFCMEGFCVSVSRMEFVYTMGLEEGVCVKIINYARLPSTDAELSDKAEKLGLKLMGDLYQGSFSIETPTGTKFYSRRESD